MAALRLGLGAAIRSGKTDALADAVRQALEKLDSEIAGRRALITDLRPAALDQIDPEAAIEALADRSRLLGLEVDVHLDLAYEQARASERLDGDLETAVCRIVQEALTNARKHGGAQRAVVDVGEGEIAVDLSVRDDGSGFEPSSPTNGFGLVGMRERVDLLNGTLTISSMPGKGDDRRRQLPRPPAPRRARRDAVPRARRASRRARRTPSAHRRTTCSGPGPGRWTARRARTTSRHTPRR